MELKCHQHTKKEAIFQWTPKFSAKILNNRIIFDKSKNQLQRVLGSTPSPHLLLGAESDVLIVPWQLTPTLLLFAFVSFDPREQWSTLAASGN